MGVLANTVGCLLIGCLPAGLAAQEIVRVRVDGSVRSVPLERYVARVVASEVYASWPAESLKAQAVVARTYALWSRERHQREGWDLESSVLSQRYGVERVVASVQGAVDHTRGQYLSYRDRPVLSVFHSAAGGRTASAEEVWGEALPYLTSVESPDDGAPDHFWSYEIGARDLASVLAEAGLDGEGAEQIEVLRYSSSGRVEQVAVGDTRLTGRELRRLLGGRALKSTLFNLRVNDGSVLFMGSGAGHGVGLSQWGARELALQQQSYREILNHYYPGTSLRRLGATQ